MIFYLFSDLKETYLFFVFNYKLGSKMKNDIVSDLHECC